MNNILKFERKRSIDEILSEVRDRLDRLEDNNHALHEKVERLEISVRSADQLPRVEEGIVGHGFKDACFLGLYCGKRCAYSCNVTGDIRFPLRFTPLGVGDLILEDWPVSREAQFIESHWQQLVENEGRGVLQGQNGSLRHNDQQISNYGTVAFASIACETYEATCVLLNYLTFRLTVGSIVHIEKWPSETARADSAFQVGFKEWLVCNPQIKLSLWKESDQSRSFSVVTC